MGRVTRDFSVVLEYDGEAFNAIFTTLTDRGSYMRPGREEFTVCLDEQDLSREVARDLKQTYQDRYDHEEREVGDLHDGLG